MTCPECGNQDDGRVMGYQVRGIYDGVLYWECLACGWAWPRDFGDWERRNAAAREHADAHNQCGSVGPPG